VKKKFEKMSFLLLSYINIIIFVKLQDKLINIQVASIVKNYHC